MTDATKSREAELPVVGTRGVGGSPAGEKAVDFVLAEATLRGVEIVALHAWPPGHGPVGTGVEPSERLPAEVLAGRTGRDPGVTVGREVVSGETRGVPTEASRTAHQRGAPVRRARERTDS